MGTQAATPATHLKHRTHLAQQHTQRTRQAATRCIVHSASSSRLDASWSNRGPVRARWALLSPSTNSSITFPSGFYTPGFYTPDFYTPDFLLSAFTFSIGQFFRIHIFRILALTAFERRQSLKSVNEEERLMLDTMTRYAIHNPTVAFQLRRLDRPEAGISIPLPSHRIDNFSISIKHDQYLLSGCYPDYPFAEDSSRISIENIHGNSDRRGRGRLGPSLITYMYFSHYHMPQSIRVSQTPSQNQCKLDFPEQNQ